MVANAAADQATTVDRTQDGAPNPAPIGAGDDDTGSRNDRELRRLRATAEKIEWRTEPCIQRWSRSRSVIKLISGILIRVPVPSRIVRRFDRSGTGLGLAGPSTAPA